MPDDLQPSASPARPSEPSTATSVGDVVGDVVGEPDGTTVAVCTVITWQALQAALSPVIGHGGVWALYRRSLHLARPLHPCLDAADPGEADAGDFSALDSALSSETGPVAAAATEALLQSFWELLTGLIGNALTERLIGFSRAPPSDAPVAQDNTP